MKMTMARQDFFNLQVKALKQLRELHRDPSFGKLLDRAVWKAPTAKERVDVNPSGSRVKNVVTPDDAARCVVYAKRRLEIVAYEMVLVEKMLKTGAVSPSTSVECGGAVWQLFQGKEGRPACHTSPGQLFFDGHLPTVLVNDPGFMRWFPLIFGDVMLMPAAVNDYDTKLDHAFGRDLLARCAKAVIAGNKPVEVVNDGFCRWLWETLAKHRDEAESAGFDTGVTGTVLHSLARAASQQVAPVLYDQFGELIGEVKETGSTLVDPSGAPISSKSG